MPGSYDMQDVKCPFFKWNHKKKRTIACEGLMPNSRISLYYSTNADYNSQLNIFCCEHYKNCEVYRMIYELKYKEE